VKTKLHAFSTTTLYETEQSTSSSGTFIINGRVSDSPLTQGWLICSTGLANGDKEKFLPLPVFERRLSNPYPLTLLR
jgi:hypothetical protein